jgi:elongation factor P
MMISVTELRGGRRFLIEGQPWEVIEYKHVKMGRGNANIKVKSKNLKTGAVLEKSFLNGSKVETIETERKALQYLYRDHDEYFFADPQTFEQSSLERKVLSGKERFLVEGSEVTFVMWDGAPLDIELPNSMVFEVAQTDPGVKGNSATNVFKPATMSNGLQVKVPLFVNIGDKVKVDTRNGEYQERAK